MVASFFLEDYVSIYWYLTPCEQTVPVRLRVCIRYTITPASMSSVTFCGKYWNREQSVVVPSDKVCIERFASGVGQAPDIVQGFPGVGPCENLARQEITLLG